MLAAEGPFSLTVPDRKHVHPYALPFHVSFFR
jgi:hypothetical protein